MQVPLQSPQMDATVPNGICFLSYTNIYAMRNFGEIEYKFRSEFGVSQELYRIHKLLLILRMKAFESGTQCRGKAPLHLKISTILEVTVKVLLTEKSQHKLDKRMAQVPGKICMWWRSLKFQIPYRKSNLAHPGLKQSFY
jgi:hypothetical protein